MLTSAAWWRRRLQGMTPEQADKFVKAVGAALVRALRPYVDAMVRFSQAYRNACWAAYRRAGMPHGETDDGLLRWMREENAKANARMARQFDAMRRSGNVLIRKPFGAA